MRFLLLIIFLTIGVNIYSNIYKIKDEDLLEWKTIEKKGLVCLCIDSLTGPCNNKITFVELNLKNQNWLKANKPLLIMDGKEYNIAPSIHVVITAYLNNERVLLSRIDNNFELFHNTTNGEFYYDHKCELG